LIRWLVYIVAFLSFVSVTLFKWNWLSDSSPTWMRYHPVTYLLLTSALLGLGTLQMRYWRPLLSWRYGPLAAMSVVLFIRAVIITASTDGSSGALGIAVTTFLTPVLLAVSAAALSPHNWRNLGAALRVLFVVNSLLALGEAATGTSLTFMQEGSVFRASGLFGHPLTAASATGMMLVYLLTSTNRQSGLVAAAPEIIVHAIAMFAFGGRTGLVLVPAMVAIAAMLPSPGLPMARRVTQRIGVIVILTSAVLATQLQIGVVQTAMSRFQSDSGSAATRFVALDIIKDLSAEDLLFGVSLDTREHLMALHGSEVAIENPYLSLILSFGLILTILITLALFIALFSQALALDRSASFMTLYFLISSSASISFGSKSLLIVQVLVLMCALGQPLGFNAIFPSPGRGDAPETPMDDPIVA